MADTPLAGYNPSVSLLHGGDNAHILPVQGGGGGGGPPDGYNAGAVVLPQPDHSVPITAVKGGGYEQEGGGYEQFLDKYELPTQESVSLPATSPETKEVLALWNEVYGKKALLKRISSQTQGVSLAAISLNIFKKVADYDIKSVQNIEKLSRVQLVVNIGQDKNLVLWIVPPIKGDLTEFLLYKKYLIESIAAVNQKKPDSKHTILFMGPFFDYSETGNMTRALKFYQQYLQFKQTAGISVYFIRTLDIESVRFEADLAKAMHTSGKKVADTNAYTFAFVYEPTEAYFVEQNLLISNLGTIVQFKIVPRQADKTILHLGAISKDVSEALIVIEPSGSPTKVTPGRAIYHIYNGNIGKNIAIRSNEIKEETLTQPWAVTQVAYKISYLLGSDPTATRNILINKPTQANPLFVLAGAGALSKRPAVAAPAAEEDEEDEEEVIIGQEPRAEAEAELAAATTAVKPKGFVAAADVFQPPGSPTVSVLLDKNYVIRLTDPRVPSTPTAAQPIEALPASAKKDWLMQKFTKEEADLFNALELTPNLLTTAFGSTWATSLAEFLEALGTQQQCLSLMKLHLSSKCQTIRLFINKVTQAKYKMALEEVYEQWDIRQPSEDKLIQVLRTLQTATLEDGMAAAASGAAVGFSEPLKTDDIFLGDLTIAFDPEEEDYYLNYVNIDAGKRRELKELEKKIRLLQKGTKRRIRSKKLDVLVRKYQEIAAAMAAAGTAGTGAAPGGAPGSGAGTGAAPGGAPGSGAAPGGAPGSEAGTGAAPGGAPGSGAGSGAGTGLGAAAAAAAAGTPAAAAATAAGAPAGQRAANAAGAPAAAAAAAQINQRPLANRLRNATGRAAAARANAARARVATASPPAGQRAANAASAPAGRGAAPAAAATNEQRARNLANQTGNPFASGQGGGSRRRKQRSRKTRKHRTRKGRRNHRK